MSEAAIMQAQMRVAAGRGLRTKAQVGRVIDRPHAAVGFPFDERCPLGIAFLGAVVRIYKIKVRHAGRVLKDSAAYRDVTITTDFDFAVVYYDPDASSDCFTVARVAGSEGGDLPGDKETGEICVPICQCRYDSARAIATLHEYLANIVATPSLFEKEDAL